MNSVLYLINERRENVIEIGGIRSTEIQERTRLLENEEILVVGESGERARAKVVSLSSSKMCLEIVEVLVSFSDLPVHLIVGICRPPTIKKVIHLATSVGVRSLTFVRTELSEKSYLSSSALAPVEIRQQVILALEQIGGGKPPKIEVQHFFKPFIEDIVGRSKGEVRLIADTNIISGGMPGGLSSLPHGKEFLVAIGGERGWSDFERDLFASSQFVPFSLGPRMYRVEHALGLILGSLTEVLSNHHH